MLYFLLPLIVFENIHCQSAQASMAKIDNVQYGVGQVWPLGIVPYNVDTNNFDAILSERLRTAMNVIEGESCMRFKAVLEPPENGSWINITAFADKQRDRQCVHAAHRNPDGEIVLRVGYECLKQKQLLHTLLHGLGLTDEITHPHRNKYVRVLWENILPEFRHLFRLQHRAPSPSLELEYDPMSIMHFHDRAYSKNGQVTVAPLLPGLQILPSNNLSQLDKLKLHLMFGHECNKRKVSTLMLSCRNVLHKHERLKNVNLFENNSHEKSVKWQGAETKVAENSGEGNDTGILALGVRLSKAKLDRFTIDRLQKIKAPVDSSTY